MKHIMEEFEGCIGIDLGTTYSCVGFWDGDHVEIIANELGKNTTPSWVAFTDTDILVGELAKNQASTNPKNTLCDIKRFIGKRYSDETVQQDCEHFSFNVVGDKNDIPLIKVTYKGQEQGYKPEQISGLVLGKMRTIAESRLGKRVKRAVITVPAYFNDSQRIATKNAATIAGLDCLKIINEPTAACLCYGLNNKTDGTNVLIFDLGGGTFDVSVLNLTGGIFEVKATSGNTHLGGEDFDQILSQYLLEQFLKKNPGESGVSKSLKSLRKLRSAAERAKCALSSSSDTLVDIDGLYDGVDFSMKLTRNKFEQLCEPVFQKCLEPVRQVLEDSHLKPEQIDEIVLVGGSTRIPRIREILSGFFSGKKLNMSINPDEAVAYGAAVQGAICSKQDTSGKTKELLLLDVTPLSLGIEAKDGIMSKIIERNSQVPTSKKKIYSTVEDKQTSVLIQIFEGEREFTKDNHKIADFELTGIPKQARGVPKIEVTFSIDGSGILSVKAVDRDTGTANEIVITDTTRLSQDEINKMIDQAEQFRADDEIKKAALNTKYSFEKYLTDIQRAVNDPELITDETGEAVLTREEIDFVNKFILNNLTWLEDDENHNKEKIEQARMQFAHGTKAIILKIFARKKQLDMRAKHIKDDTIDDKDLTKIEQHAHDMFGEDLTEPTAAPVQTSATVVKPKVQVKVNVKAKPKISTASHAC